MPDTKSTQSSGTRPSLGRSGMKRIIQSFVSTLIMGALLFLTAGQLDWTEAWVFSSLFLLFILTATVWGVRTDPDLMNERGSQAENVMGWDKITLAIRMPLFFLLPVIAGLDAGRYGWSAMPLTWQVLGFAGLIPAMVMPVWTMSANPFLSAVVRIQDDRGHQVATTGPYQYVRHPMYVGVIFFGLCTPLFLGSWWALIPGGLMAVLFVIRTALEDRSLQEELPGYSEYAQRVHYRLLPYVW